MADKRFPWPRAPYLDKCYELKRRNCRRVPLKDTGLKCLVKECQKPCKAGQEVYLPSLGVNTALNKTAAHVECIDWVVDQHTSSSAHEAKVVAKKEQAKKGIVVVPATIDVKAQLAKLIEQAKKEAYERGFEAGRQSAVTEMASLLGESEELTH